MTDLLSRLRPARLHAARFGRNSTDRAELELSTALPAADERLATRSEIERLGAKHLTRVISLDR